MMPYATLYSLSSATILYFRISRHIYFCMHMPTLLPSTASHCLYIKILYYRTATGTDKLVWYILALRYIIGENNYYILLLILYRHASSPLFSACFRRPPAYFSNDIYDYRSFAFTIYFAWVLFSLHMTLLQPCLGNDAICFNRFFIWAWFLRHDTRPLYRCSSIRTYRKHDYQLYFQPPHSTPPLSQTAREHIYSLHMYLPLRLE